MVCQTGHGIIVKKRSWEHNNDIEIDFSDFKPENRYYVAKSKKVIIASMKKQIYDELH